MPQGFLRKARPLRVSRDLSRGPKGVGDGQQVDIPVPPPHHLSNGGTQEDRVSAVLDIRVQAVRLGNGKSVSHKAEL